MEKNRVLIWAQCKNLIGMKRLIFKNFVLLLLIGNWFGLLIFIAGCSRNRSNEICGTYSFFNDGVTDTLTLYTNGTFLQIVNYTNGQNWTLNGSWELHSENIQFDKFFSVFDLDPIKGKIIMVTPPVRCSLENLWVEKGRLLKDPAFPIWNKVLMNSSTNGP